MKLKKDKIFKREIWREKKKKKKEIMKIDKFLK